MHLSVVSSQANLAESQASNYHPFSGPRFNGDPASSYNQFHFQVASDHHHMCSSWSSSRRLEAVFCSGSSSKFSGHNKPIVERERSYPKNLYKYVKSHILTAEERTREKVRRQPGGTIVVVITVVDVEFEIW